MHDQMQEMLESLKRDLGAQRRDEWEAERRQMQEEMRNILDFQRGQTQSFKEIEENEHKARLLMEEGLRVERHELHEEDLRLKAEWDAHHKQLQEELMSVMDAQESFLA